VIQEEFQSIGDSLLRRMKTGEEGIVFFAIVSNLKGNIVVIKMPSLFNMPKMCT